MLALYLIAAHLVGDFVFQNRWMAADKLTSRLVRAEHVATYCIPFIPIAAWRASDWTRMGLFVGLLAVLHYATDSRRFHSTLGDVVQWRIDAWRDPLAVKQDWLAYVVRDLGHGPRAIDVSDEAVRWPIPNPWPATPLMIDQTLHLCQLAILGGIFL